MKNVLLMIRNGAFAVAIAVALSGTAFPDNPCQFPDEYCEDDRDCDEICTPPYYGGTCDHHYECCVCFE